MIVEDERDRYDYNKKETFEYEQAPFAVEESYSRDGVAEESVIQRNKDQILDSSIHRQLHADLIQHQWNRYGNSHN